MTIEDAVKQFVNQKKKERVPGHYWASEIYKVKKGYFRTKDFFNRPEITDNRSIGNICQGIAGENFLAHALTELKVPFVAQERFEIKISDDFYISGKADFKFKGGIFEVKAPAQPLEGIPERYKDQLEAYYQAFKLPVYLCEINFNPFKTRVWPYESEKGRWEEGIEALSQFDKKVKKLWKSQSEKK